MGKLIPRGIRYRECHDSMGQGKVTTQYYKNHVKFNKLK